VFQVRIPTRSSFEFKVHRSNAGNCGSIQRQPTSAATEDSRVARALDVAVRRVRIRRRTANVCVAAVTLVPILRSGNAETLGRTGELTCFRCQAR
jgi:hypothetical protein